jgi:diguanylate cyclase (GGDEF)-like protein
VADEWDEEDTKTTAIEDIAASVSGRTVPTLTVLTGSSTGQALKLRQTVTIGRATEAELRIADDGISRHHARVHYAGEVASVEDLASRNGTFVNGRRLSAPVTLHDGDKIQLGRSTVIRFAFQDALDESFHENLMSSALRDGLTKLFNKRYFLDRLDSELKFALRHQTSLSLLMIDLDHFKKVNDTFGHLAGDAVLSNIASTLSRAVRNEDVVARFGGEEFAIVLRSIPLDSALHMAERLRRVIEQTPIHFNDHTLLPTVSIGVAGFPTTPVKTPAELVEAADQALYRAKNAGRNRVSR